MEYGYVITQLASGSWWHMHFGRCRWIYHCDLLGRNSDVLAVIQKFTTGANPKSPRFILTLDGEGVNLADDDLGFDFRWGSQPYWSSEPADPESAADALHFQREIMPILYDNEVMGRAVSEVVTRGRHLKLVPLGKLVRAEPNAAENAVTPDGSG